MHDSIYTSISDFEKLETEWNKQFKKLIEILPSDNSVKDDICIAYYKEECKISKNKIRSIELDEIYDLDEDSKIISSKFTGYYPDRQTDNDFWKKEYEIW